MRVFNEEQKILLQTVTQFGQTELLAHAQKLDEEEGWDDKTFRKMGELGLFGITVSPELGGSGLGAFETTLVIEELSKYCASTALSYLAHTVLCVNNLHENASAQQKKKYLPKLVSGALIGGMAMTEPGSGSDSLAMKMVGRKEKNKYVLNGTKMFITNGPVGDVFVVYARTGQNKKDISTFIIEKHFPGFKVGKKLHKLGMRASPTSELIFENCEVPEENLVGRENDSVAHMMKNLNIERITISGISLGIAKASLDYATRYAKERSQFGSPLSKFQMIQDKIAMMGTDLEAGRALTYASAKAYDRGDRSMSLGAKSKLFTAQMATRVALEAVQILGGYGYIKEYPVERYLRDAKLMEIGAGTNEVMKILVAQDILGLRD